MKLFHCVFCFFIVTSIILFNPLQACGQSKRDQALQHNKKGLEYAEEGNSEKAIEEFKTAIDLFPDYPDAHFYLGKEYFKRKEIPGSLEACAKEWEKVLELSPEYPAINYNLGNAYYELEETDKAITHYKEATKKDPLDRPSFVQLGNIYYKNKDMKLAIEYYGRAITLNPIDPELHLRLAEKASYWRQQADRIHRFVCEGAWSDKRNSFVSTIGGNSLDASLLLMQEIGFLHRDDPRFAATVTAVERELKKGDFIFRYVEEDDFGAPVNAFIVCTFWYIYALVALGRRDEARRLFENLLSHRNPHGLLAEHIDPVTGEQWGNFVQTYSMVGVINSAIRLSLRWDEAF